MRQDELGLVPPGRFGRLLAQSRQRDELSLEQMAFRVGSAFTAEALDRIELGLVLLADEDIVAVAEGYGFDTSRLLPGRSGLVTDVDADALARSGPLRTLMEEADTESVLGRYLALVYALRALPVGTPIPLRSGDIDLLARSLEVEPDEVAEQARHMMRASARRIGDHSDQLRRRILVPAAGILVAVTPTGSLLMVNGEPPPRPPERREESSPLAERHETITS